MVVAPIHGPPLVAYAVHARHVERVCARPEPVVRPSDHRPFHEHLGAGAHSGYGGTLELWRLWSRLNHLAHEAERIRPVMVMPGRRTDGWSGVAEIAGRVGESGSCSDGAVNGRSSPAASAAGSRVRSAYAVALGKPGKIIDVLL